VRPGALLGDLPGAAPDHDHQLDLQSTLSLAAEPCVRAGQAGANLVNTAAPTAPRTDSAACAVVQPESRTPASGSAPARRAGRGSRARRPGCLGRRPSRATRPLVEHGVGSAGNRPSLAAWTSTARCRTSRDSRPDTLATRIVSAPSRSGGWLDPRTGEGGGADQLRLSSRCRVRASRSSAREVVRREEGRGTGGPSCRGAGPPRSRPAAQGVVDDAVQVAVVLEKLPAGAQVPEEVGPMWWRPSPQMLPFPGVASIAEAPRPTSSTSSTSTRCGAGSSAAPVHEDVVWSSEQAGTPPAPSSRH